MARKPPALARELLRNFPKRRARNARRRRKGGAAKPGQSGAANGAATQAPLETSLSRGRPEDPRPDPQEDLRHEVQDALEHRDLDHAGEQA